MLKAFKDFGCDIPSAMAERTGADVEFYTSKPVLKTDIMCDEKLVISAAKLHPESMQVFSINLDWIFSAWPIQMVVRSNGCMVYMTSVVYVWSL